MSDRKTRLSLVALIVMSIIFLCSSLRATAAQLRTNELVMFDQIGCPFCAAWEREVGKSYRKTDEGKQLPLRRVDLHAKRPSDLLGIRGVIYTPTFILMHCGHEIARITGYSGSDLFWEALDVDLAKLKASAPCKATGAHA